MNKSTLAVVLLLCVGAVVLLIYGYSVLSRGGSDDPTIVSVPPPVTERDPVLGSSDARVTIIEFSDFECPFCKNSQSILTEILEKYPDDVRLVWKDMPNEDSHPHAASAARAARCAQDQGKFWEYHDLLFANQAQLSDETYTVLAGTLNLNVPAFQSCLLRPVPDVVRQGLQEGLDRGITATPHYFVNSLQKSGSITIAELESLVKSELR